MTWIKADLMAWRSRQKKLISDISAKKIRWFRTRLVDWSKNNLREYPWRNNTEPYEILIAEFLLQRTDADTVKPIYEEFLNRYSTLDKLASAQLEDIATILQPLGLFFRAERLFKTAKIITTEYQGRVPDLEAELLKLPGIGQYTARAICSQAFQQPSAVMDTNVARIIERFFGIKGERVKSRCKILWQAAETIAPKRKVGLWNLTLLDFGALICTARNPKCSNCPVAKRCDYFNGIAD